MAVWNRKYRTPHSRLLFVVLLYGGYGVLYSLASLIAASSGVYGGDQVPGQAVSGGRHLLQAEGKLNCTPRSIDEFPGDFITEAQRKQGGVFIHVLITLYIFGALAIICDDYFVSSLEKICDALKLKPDVAGATFMAGGSSAPELFTSVVGVFFAKSDVGVGTIVGSAVFNILFIVAICGLFSGAVIYLTCWPLIRDCSYYLLSVAVLILVIYDETVHWYEALCMLLLYFVYIGVMYFNERLEAMFNDKFSRWMVKRGLQQGFAQESEKSGLLDSERSPLLGSSGKKSNDGPSVVYSGATGTGSTSNRQGSSTDLEEEEFESPFTIPDTFLKRVFWVTLLPITCAFVLTVPDCRRPGCWQNLYIATFVMSIAWIAGLSYVMVWMVTIIGDTAGISDTVMGLSFLAAGTSVPDALASLFVARDGYGDMAVSNSIGSNVFDILLCLGLPWLLQTGMVAPDTTVDINSSGLTFSAVTLLGTVVFMLLSVSVNGWKLDKKHGAACLLVYALFLLFSIMYELNVFMYVNDPPCPRTSHW